MNRDFLTRFLFSISHPLASRLACGYRKCVWDFPYASFKLEIYCEISAEYDAWQTATSVRNILDFSKFSGMYVCSSFESCLHMYKSSSTMRNEWLIMHKKKIWIFSTFWALKSLLLNLFESFKLSWTLKLFHS